MLRGDFYKKNQFDRLFCVAPRKTAAVRRNFLGNIKYDKHLCIENRLGEGQYKEIPRRVHDRKFIQEIL